MNSIHQITLALAGSLLCTATVGDQHVGIEDSAFAPSHRSMENQYWSWAAAVQMVLAHSKVNVTQKALMEPCLASNTEARDLTARASRMRSYSNGLVNDAEGKSVFLSGVAIDGTPRSSVLHNHLKAGQPLILFIENREYVHAVVATGLDFEFDPAASSKKFVTKSLHVWDPFDFKTVKDWRGTRLDKDEKERKKVLRIQSDNDGTQLYYEEFLYGRLVGAMLVRGERIEKK